MKKDNKLLDFETATSSTIKARYISPENCSIMTAVTAIPST